MRCSLAPLKVAERKGFLTSSFHIHRETNTIREKEWMRLSTSDGLGTTMQTCSAHKQDFNREDIMNLLGAKHTFPA
jgi:putative heme degradation protein